MSTFPTPYTVQVRERHVLGQDDRGNDQVGWATAEWAVSVIAPGAMTEPAKENRTQSNIVWTLYGPKEGGYPRDEHAQVKLPGGSDWFDVSGRPRDFTQTSPWTPLLTPPYVVELERVEG